MSEHEVAGEELPADPEHEDFLLDDDREPTNEREGLLGADELGLTPPD
jgi:hypothetical protein